MRRGIGLRGYAQQDPLNEFRREAFRLYEELRGLIRHGVATSIFRVTVQRQPAPGTAQPLPGPGQPARPAAVTAGASGNGAAAAAGAATGGAPVLSSPVAGSAILRGALPAAPAVRNVRESVGDVPVAGGTAGGASLGGAAAEPGWATTRLSRRPGRGSAATTRATADRARSTRSATAAERAVRRSILVMRVVRRLVLLGAVAGCRVRRLHDLPHLGCRGRATIGRPPMRSWSWARRSTTAGRRPSSPPGSTTPSSCTARGWRRCSS